MARLQSLRDSGAKVVQAGTEEGSVTIGFEENGTRITSTGPTSSHRWSTFASNQEETLTNTFLDHPDRAEVKSGSDAQKFKQHIAKVLYPLENNWQVVE